MFSVAIGRMSKRLKSEFDTVMVNEASAKLHCVLLTFVTAVNVLIFEM